MGISSAVFKEAFEIKKREQHNARVRFDKLRDELYSANPRLLEIERELGALGAKTAITAFSGDEARLSELKNQADALRAERDKILAGVNLEEHRYACPECADTGYLQNGKICNCVKQIAKEVSRKRLCEDMPIDKCSFDNFDLSFYSDAAVGNTTPKKRMTQVLKICRTFAENFANHSDNLLLLGGTGLGKTHLSLSIAATVLEGDNSVIYCSVQNLINKLSAETFSYSGSTEVSDSVLGADLLIIDDLGSEMNTAFSQSCIYNIINTRIMRGLSTVISTNLTLEDIEKQYTARVASRIIGNYTLLQCLGADIRQQKAIKAIKNK